ncbi:MAG: nucleotidyltransferase domain-containing protein [Gemmatimonadetes bacterium]|nr:nucleotidyltransferase domain-containing protein [Gemmatimonadota bacterium]
MSRVSYSAMELREAQHECGRIGNIYINHGGPHRERLPASRVVLFGSHARGTATEWSDVAFPTS